MLVCNRDRAIEGTKKRELSAKSVPVFPVLGLDSVSVVVSHVEHLGCYMSCGFLYPRVFTA